MMRASFNCSHSYRSRRSVCDWRPFGPGSDQSIPALPASTNRSRQLPGHSMAPDASVRDSSPFNTTRTTRICASTDTYRDGFCCLDTPAPTATPQRGPCQRV